MKEEGQRGCSGTIMKREVFKKKTVLGEIKPGRDDLQLCNCFILASFEQQ